MNVGLRSHYVAACAAVPLLIATRKKVSRHHPILPPSPFNCHRVCALLSLLLSLPPSFPLSPIVYTGRRHAGDM